MNSDLNQVVKLDQAGFIPPLLKAELKAKIESDSDDGLDIFQPNPSLQKNGGTPEVVKKEPINIGAIRSEVKFDITDKSRLKDLIPPPKDDE